MAEPKSIVLTPEWERHTRRLHALSRINERIGQELMRASGKRTSDPDFREWLHELAAKTTELLERDRQQFIDFADAYGDGQEANPCTRHAAVEDVLSPSSLERVAVMVVEACEDINGEHFFDGHSGLVIGKGYRAWANDFPVGTKLIITAKIELPEVVKP